MVAIKYYVLDRQKLTVPIHLQRIIPRDAHDTMQKVRMTTAAALKHLRIIESLHSRRHKAMCPLSHPQRYIMHSESVDRLFNNNNNNNNGESNSRLYNHLHPTTTSIRTPAPEAAKLSRDVLHFHVSQRAYDLYARKYTDVFESFITGPYKKWIDAKRNFEKRMANAGLAESDYQQWHRWWITVFLAEMSKWENQLPKLATPSWEEVVDEIHKALLERAEPGTLPEFYINQF